MEDAKKIKDMKSHLEALKKAVKELDNEINIFSNDKMFSASAKKGPDEIDSIREKLKTLRDKKKELEVEKNKVAEKVKDLESHQMKKEIEDLRKRRDKIVKEEIPESHDKIEKLEKEKRKLDNEILRIANITAKRKYE